MKFSKLVDRLATMEIKAGELHKPQPETIAFSVRWSREQRRWKQATLADMAGVSLSTIERIERAEVVSDDCLDKVAVALGCPIGHFTALRIPLSKEAAAERILEAFEDKVAVDIAPLEKQVQLRALADCDAIISHAVDVTPEMEGEVACLLEWLDLAGFILHQQEWDETAGDAPRRKLYGDIFQQVQVLKKSGLAVLVGVATLPSADGHEHKVAVLVCASKKTDPGASKRRVALLDTRCITNPFAATLPLRPEA